MLDDHLHPLSELFIQLGLPSDTESIRTFIAKHAPLAAHMVLPDAPCWDAAQAAVLREKLLEDANWSYSIDQLNLSLRATPVAGN